MDTRDNPRVSFRTFPVLSAIPGNREVYDVGRLYSCKNSYVYIRDATHNLETASPSLYYRLRGNAFTGNKAVGGAGGALYTVDPAEGLAMYCQDDVSNGVSACMLCNAAIGSPLSPSSTVPISPPSLSLPLTSHAQPGCTVFLQGSSLQLRGLALQAGQVVQGSKLEGQRCLSRRVCV